MTKKGKKRQLSETESSGNTQISNNKFSPKKNKLNEKQDSLEKDNKQKAIDKVHKKIVEQENSPAQSLKNKKKKNKKQNGSAVSPNTQTELKKNNKKSKQLENAAVIPQETKTGEKSDLVEQPKNSSEDSKLLKKLKKKQKKAAKKNLQKKSEDHSVGENKSAETSEKPNSPQKAKDVKVVSSKRKELYKKKRQDFREKRKEIRKEDGLFSSVKKLTVDEMKEKIAEIENRETISNSAKRKLRILKKKLGVEDGTFETQQNLKRKSDSADQEKLNKNKKLKSDWSETIPTITNADKKGNKKNSNKKKGKLPITAVTKEQLFIEDKTGDLLADSGESHDEDDDNETSEADNNVVNVLKYANGNSLSEEGSEDEAEDNGTEDSEDEDENETDEGEQPTKQKKLNTNLELKNKKGKTLDFKKENKSVDFKKQDRNNTNANAEKKQRYVVFVGNCAYDTTTVDLKKHFLTKVSIVKDVRIPLAPGTNKPRGFAYVELDNKEDYEKSLSLHGTSLNNRQIKVEYTTSGKKLGNKKQEIVHKNKKLHAMRKAGMLAGSKKDSQKRSFRRNFKKNPQNES